MVSHHDGTKYDSIGRVLLTIKLSSHSLGVPLPSHFKIIVSYSSTYQKLTKCSYLG